MQCYFPHKSPRLNSNSEKASTKSSLFTSQNILVRSRAHASTKNSLKIHLISYFYVFYFIETKYSFFFCNKSLKNSTSHTTAFLSPNNLTGLKYSHILLHPTRFIIVFVISKAFLSLNLAFNSKYIGLIFLSLSQ